MSAPVQLIAAFACLGLAATACTPVRVTTEVADDVDFSRYATYAQVAASGGEPAEGGVRAQTAANLRRAIDVALQDKGYRLAGSAEPDLRVEFAVRDESTVRRVNAGDPDTDYQVSREFAEGTLVVTISDARDGRRLWRGVGKTEIAASGALLKQDPERAALDSVREVLDRFPAANPRDS